VELHDTSSSNQTVARRSIVLPAPVSDVWRVLTDPEERDAWLGDDAKRPMFVEDVEPERALAFWWWDDDTEDAPSHVTYELEEVPAGTRLVVTERRVEVPAFAPQARALAMA
jgi:uncharacterized protein YndB with AHSA1/START domain